MVTELERRAAIDAVAAASELCSWFQHRLVDGDRIVKGDLSPVTVADFAAQAVVGTVLTELLGEIEIVGEEDPADLRDPQRVELCERVIELVRHQLGDATTAEGVLATVALGGSDGRSERYWTLDPIDGTKGFLRGDQYAIALALIERGDVVLGVLGCPN